MSPFGPSLLVWREEFERHEAAKPGVFRLINYAHRTTAELLDDAIVRDGLTDQWEGFRP